MSACAPAAFPYRNRLPAAELEAIGGDQAKANEVLDVIVRRHGRWR
jgi:hypothetical protein